MSDTVNVSVELLRQIEMLLNAHSRHVFQDGAKTPNAIMCDEVATKIQTLRAHINAAAGSGGQSAAPIVDRLQQDYAAQSAVGTPKEETLISSLHLIVNHGNDSYRHADKLARGIHAVFAELAAATGAKEGE